MGKRQEQQCAFIISNDEAKTYESLGENAIVYAQKLAKDYGITDKTIIESQLLTYPNFFRLVVVY